MGPGPVDGPGEPGDHPDHRLARPAPPPYRGEGPHALWHLSEDPRLHRLVPRSTPSNPSEPALVWAIDTRHAPTFWFPRQCPRACAWLSDRTSDEDRAWFRSQSGPDVDRIHVIESDWYPAVAEVELYAYRLPMATFRPHHVGGYWVSDRAVLVEERIAVGDVVAAHAAAAIELRIVPSLWPWWYQVVARSTLEFSGSRLRNAARPEPLELRPPSITGPDVTLGRLASPPPARPLPF